MPPRLLFLCHQGHKILKSLCGMLLYGHAVDWIMEVMKGNSGKKQDRRNTDGWTVGKLDGNHG